MSDILVVDKADEAIAFAGNAVTDLDGLLDHITVDVLGGLNLDELLDLDDLDDAVGHVLGIVPDLVGGLVSGLGLHVDHTVDVLVDQSLGLTAVLNPVGEPLAEIVSQITATLGVTDELPARLQALAGIAIVGSDSVLSNLSGILDATLGLGLADGVLGVADVGLTQGPATVQGTAEESAGASHGLLDSLLTDVDDAGQAHLGSDLLIGVQGLVHSVPETLDAAVAVVLTDTLAVPVPEVVDHTTNTVDTLLVDPTSVDVGAELEHTLSAVEPLVNETVAGLNLGLDGLG